MYVRMTLLIFFLFHYIIAINGFNPLSLPTSSSSNNATHESITRCAVATVTSEDIQTHFGINITVPSVVNGICPTSFSLIKTAFSTIQNSDGNTYLTLHWSPRFGFLLAI